MMATRAKQLNEAEPISIDRALEAGRKADEKRKMHERFLKAAAGAEYDRRWFVLRVAHRPEREVVAELDDSGLEAWAPVKTVWRTVFHSKKKRAAHRPVFRSYVFVRAVPSAEAWHGLLGIKGVRAVLGGGSGPFPISDETMNKLMGLVKAGVFDQKKNARPYRIGETVRVKDGPFADFTGVLEGYAASRGVRVLASLFGREVPVELTLAQIEKFD
ncbi:transcription termination/antitermination protein NusG [Chelativorans sp. YIM 93263]|uniref:transcription termination/antitermination protein NusG n=1 Tax=Chelativorans sp. YIM 93263 TaxID=2906648 RepID=UPI0023783C96|nr:transcription termination/antitermination protein NusG [Chelativorans sp. YIM 93263]